MIRFGSSVCVSFRRMHTRTALVNGDGASWDVSVHHRRVKRQPSIISTLTVGQHEQGIRSEQDFERLGLGLASVFGSGTVPYLYH